MPKLRYLSRLSVEAKSHANQPSVPMEAACNDGAPPSVPPVVDEMDGEPTPPDSAVPLPCRHANPPVQLTNVTRPRMTVH